MTRPARTLFPSVDLFKKTVRERFLVALREIYKTHPVYSWRPKDSAIHIEPTYADLSRAGQRPQMIVKVGSYDFSLKDTLHKNMMEEAKNSQGVFGGYRSFNIYSTVVQIIVRAYAEEESSDMADELISLGVWSAHHMFTQLGLDIEGARCGETENTEGISGSFDTPVRFEVAVPWEMVKVSEEEPPEAGIGIDLPEKDQSKYWPPGVNVFHHTSQERKQKK